MVNLPLWRHLGACLPHLAGAVLRMGTNVHLHVALSRLGEEELLLLCCTPASMWGASCMSHVFLWACTPEPEA